MSEEEELSPAEQEKQEKAKKKKVKAKAKALREQELNDVRAVMNTVEGRRFMWRVLGFTNLFASINRADNQIWYLSGKQDVGHFLQGEVTVAAPKAYLLMQSEAIEAEMKNG
jgi:hypothetical protein